MNLHKFIFSIVLLVTLQQSIIAQSRLKFEQLEEYKLTIYLPSGYSSSRTYPTVYFNDGQMLFGKFDMNLKSTLDSLIKNDNIGPLIVVGIHADQYRSEKYVPYNDAYVHKVSSKHQAYADFLTKRLIPWIDTKYSTNKTADQRAIFGVSFGGLNATWMTLNYPKYFSFSAGLSASYWVNNNEIFTEAKKRSEGQTFWFDIGTAEWNYYVSMIDALESAGGTYGKDIYYLEDPNAKHNAIWWGKRVGHPLLLFAGAKEPAIKKMSVEIEVIPSQSRKGIYYQRINPIMTCKSGLKYSLAQKAVYTILNSESGKVKPDGRFSFTGTDNLQVFVKYGDFEKKITLNYKRIQKLKK